MIARVLVGQTLLQLDGVEERGRTVDAVFVDVVDAASLRPTTTRRSNHRRSRVRVVESCRPCRRRYPKRTGLRRGRFEGRRGIGRAAGAAAPSITALKEHKARHEQTQRCPATHPREEHNDYFNQRLGSSLMDRAANHRRERGKPSSKGYPTPPLIRTATQTRLVASAVPL